MSYESEMQAALIADGEKLRAMTGEDHGPWDSVGTLDEIMEAAAVAELQRQLATAIAERDHWKANHAEMVQRNAVLRERPDLPADRLPSIARYEAGLETLRAALVPFAGYEVTSISLDRPDGFWVIRIPTTNPQPKYEDFFAARRAIASIGGQP